MEKDIFGFADAINLDHLNLKQLEELEKLLEKIKWFNFQLKVLGAFVM